MTTWRFLGVAGAGLAAGAACLVAGALLDLPIVAAAGAVICVGVIVGRDVWFAGPAAYARGLAVLAAVVAVAFVAQIVVGD